MLQLLVPVWPEAASQIGVGRTRMFELVASGEIESVKLGRKRMIPPDALVAYVERLRRTPDTAA